jgi:hypothetical protein
MSRPRQIQCKRGHEDWEPYTRKTAKGKLSTTRRCKLCHRLSGSRSWEKKKALRLIRFMEAFHGNIPVAEPWMW